MVLPLLPLREEPLDICGRNVSKTHLRSVARSRTGKFPAFESGRTRGESNNETRRLVNEYARACGNRGSAAADQAPPATFVFVHCRCSARWPAPARSDKASVSSRVLLNHGLCRRFLQFRRRTLPPPLDSARVEIGAGRNCRRTSDPILWDWQRCISAISHPAACYFLIKQQLSCGCRRKLPLHG